MMKQSKMRVVAGLAAVASVFGAPTFAVGVGLGSNGIFFPDGTMQTTAATSEVENYFQAAASVSVSVGFAGVLNTPVMDVPEGYRALIEYASVKCGSPEGTAVVFASFSTTQRTSGSSTVSRSFQVPIQYQGNDPFTGNTYVGGQIAHLYADRGLSGGGVAANVIRASGTGTTSCFFSINGRHIPIPPNEPFLQAAVSSASPTELVVPSSAWGPGTEEQAAEEGVVVKLTAPPGP